MDLVVRHWWHRRRATGSQMEDPNAYGAEIAYKGSGRWKTHVAVELMWRDFCHTTGRDVKYNMFVAAFNRVAEDDLRTPPITAVAVWVGLTSQVNRKANVRMFRFKPLRGGVGSAL